MAARACAVREQDLNRSRSMLRSDLRPLCRAIAMVVAAGLSVHAHAGGIMNLGHIGNGMATAGVGGVAGGAMPNLGVSPQQALQASQPSIRNLGHAAQAIAAQIAAQQAAAAAAAAAPSTVPNGLTVGGLQVAPGVTFAQDTNVSQTTDTSKPVLWINANGPTQTVDTNGNVTVDVKQTGQNAVLTWQTMNVGKQTTLNFDQSAGTQTNGANNWAVLNRINDPSGAPSQILGHVNAQGSVYVINRNGIVFGAGSQVNVHSLVASSLNLLDMSNKLVQSDSAVAQSNQLFLGMAAGTTGGLANPEAGSSTKLSGSTANPNAVLGLGSQYIVDANNPLSMPGDISIAPGASITTHLNGTVTDGGFVMVAAPNVTNSGSITATAGQVVLAAGVGVSLLPNPGSGNAGSYAPQTLLPELSGQIARMQNGLPVDLTPPGTLINSGIVQASRGTVNMLGSRIAQNGVVGVTTSVSTPGNITLSTVDEYSSNNPLAQSYSSNGTPVSMNQQSGGITTHRAGLLSFGPDSVTAVMPDDNGQTATSTPGTIFTPGSVNMTAGSVWFEGGSLIEAPGSKVSVTALTPKVTFAATPPGQMAVEGRIYLDNGAAIDVSGLSNVELPIAQTLVTIDRLGQNELADSPLLRDGFLFGMKNVVVDGTLSGTRSDGVEWVGSPILNLSGYVNLIPRTVDQLLTNGGNITLSGNEVMTAAGSSMDLNGGYVHYDGGMVNTTRLVDASGAIVPIGQASPYDTFVGIAGEFTEKHPRWGVTKTWYNTLETSGGYQGDYIVGGNAGTLDIFAQTAAVLDGDFTALAFGGSKQAQTNNLPSGGTFNLGADAKATTPINSLTQNQQSDKTGETSLVILQPDAPDLQALAPGFSINTALDPTAFGSMSATDPNNVFKTIVVPVGRLNAGGFSTLYVGDDKINGKGFVVAPGTALNLQPGGSVTLAATGSTGATTTVAGTISAPSGHVTISTSGDLTVTSTGSIDVAGQWVNNDTQSAPATTQGNSEYINGGSISLSADGHLDLQPGSVLDVSGGGETTAKGTLLTSNGVPAGKGGSVSLVTYDGDLATLPMDPYLTMAGTIRSFGFSGGGTLTLGAGGFRIGGDPANVSPWDIVLPTDFFEKQGFGNYVLNALYSASVAPGATVSLTQENLLPTADGLQQLGTGANLATSGLVTVGALDTYHRQPTSLVMTGAGYLGIAGMLKGQDRTSDSPPAIPAIDGSVGQVSIGEGASIIGDAGASIGLGSPAQVTVLGLLIAPGGTITLSAENGSGHSVTGQHNSSDDASLSSNSQSVWLGPNALLDVSGVALTNPLVAPIKSGSTLYTPKTGKVLPGGSVVIADDSGYIVAQPGSVINVSGSSAVFDQLSADGQYVATSAWSDAGSITLAGSSGLYFDGTLKGQAGAPQAEGGTLSLTVDGRQGFAFRADGSKLQLPGPTAIVLQQSGDLIPQGLTVGQDILAATGATMSNDDQSTTTIASGVLQFAADRLKNSGISTLVVGNQAQFGVVPVAFSGNVDLSLSRAVQIYSNELAALSGDQLNSLLRGVQDSPGHYAVPTIASLLKSEAASTTPVNIDSTVKIDAPYVSIVSPRQTIANPIAPIAASSRGTLDINASFIDLQNQFQLSNFGQANLNSTGDIRLSSTQVGDSLMPGVLYTPGNLSFTAADLYPATGNAFILQAMGPTPTTISFGGNGGSSTPLSAGGSLLVDANNIVQAGTVCAPSGSIVFGVGDPNDSGTESQFAGLKLVATDSVTFANGSLTSVSNDGSIIPYGVTVDGTDWQFNPDLRLSAKNLTAPPAKYIGVNGNSVELNKGATIDLSGGGDLQASEWVPGTGGTRDVLSQYTVSYANNPTGVAVPTNVGATNVYAIVPGAQSPVSAYDPVFAQTVQPSTNGNGTAGTTTATLGIGQAQLNGVAGQAVYLSGVPGLAPGYYTLLPGKYATLPGAYRVTVSSNTAAVAPGATQLLPDGTVVTAGYFGDALTGARSATPTLFNVQSGPVWQQSSQYTLTKADSFFTTLANTKGNVTPPLPADGGQLVLAATKALTLGAALNTAADTDGAAAEVDIASQDIEITGGNNAPALPGYLQIGADVLDGLNAGSLLIGGTRTATTSGVTITPIADSVVLSNAGGTALTGSEVMLVTKTDKTSTDPNAANGLRVDAGSAMTASGSYPAAKDASITIAGDGALLRVSNGAMTGVTRTGSSGTGVLTIGAGATLQGGQALTLDSSGNLKVDPTAVLSGNAIAVDGSAITLTSQQGAAASSLPGFVLGPTGLAQLSNSKQILLRSLGAINFDGDVNATFGNNVVLSAGTFTGDGNVTLNAKQIAFTNDMGAPEATASLGNGTLTVNAPEIDFGAGTKNASGFGSVTMNATSGIAGQGSGTFDLGAAAVVLSAPVFLADTSSASTIKTSGTLTLNQGAGTALSRQAVGGAVNFIGGTIADNGAHIIAPAGNVSLESSSGDLTIGNGSTISSAGVAKQFFDVTAFAPAGSISLTADNGTVDVQSGATLDFSGANGGGAAGSLALSAPKQGVDLNGTIKGGAASGYMGGSFSLDTASSADLDSLAATLATSGVDDSITIHTRTGNLQLSAGNTLTAYTVSLTADGGAGSARTATDGNVNVLGTINASGSTGGEIDLYGRNGVDVDGTLIARACATGNACDDQPQNLNPNQRGGTVKIGTTALFNPNIAQPYNTTYGYENIDPANAGVISIGSNALLDVSGGTAGGLSGGTVSLRAPVLDDGAVNVNIPGAFNAGRGIVGSRATTLEAYAVWSTTDATTGAQHFDGVVDPAGWFDNKGHLLAGTFTGQGSGGTFTFTPNSDGTAGGTLTNTATGAQFTIGSDPQSLAQLYTGVSANSFTGFGGLDNMYFAPTSVNSDHQAFYGYQSDGTTPGALMRFVQAGLSGVSNPFVGKGIANAAVVPGVELDNPSAAINGGDIQVLTTWNLGAGTSPTNLAFRFNGQAPIVTFRADDNVRVKASLTDGFFQILNPVGGGGTIPVPSPSTVTDATALYTQPAGYAGLSYGKGLSYYGVNSPYPSQRYVQGPGNPVGGTADEIAEYYALYSAYAEFLASPAPSWHNAGADMLNAIMGASSYPRGSVAAPVPPSASQQQTDPGSYLIYVSQYKAYLLQVDALNSKGHWTNPEMVQAPLVEPVTPIASTTIPVPAATDNSVSPLAESANPLPVQSASLAQEASSTFRLVAGANLTSADPLSLKPALTFRGTSDSGNLTLDGHSAYIDANGLALLAPTAIRTGVGSLSLASANGFSLLDPVAPGVVYTAGSSTNEAPNGNSDIAIASGSAGDPDIMVLPTTHPNSAGDVSILAQGDIKGIEYTTDSTGAVTGNTNNTTSQFWWQWREIGNPIGAVGSTNPHQQTVQTSINFGAFDQGVMSVGGNVSISAGGNISDLAVSLPTTWYLTATNTDQPVLHTVGGGNLSVRAGGDILSGDYFVAKGTGKITAAGRIGSDISVSSENLGQPAVRVGTVLATQDGAMSVVARQGIEIGAILNPSDSSVFSLPGDATSRETSPQLDAYSHTRPDLQPYSGVSAVTLLSTDGDVQLGSLASLLTGATGMLPASLGVTALNGGISIQSGGTLYPSSVGQLNLIADQSVEMSNSAVLLTGAGLAPATFGMSDSDPSLMPSPTNWNANPPTHATFPLHRNDTTPARVYSLNGDIVDGTLQTSGSDSGFYTGDVVLSIDKPAIIEAGRDVLNLTFEGQNLRGSDVTRILAGRDIYDAPLIKHNPISPYLILGGPGTFDVEAGRNIGPLTGEAEFHALNPNELVLPPTGIEAVGNSKNPYLPHESANVNVLFGVGPGVDVSTFVSTYIDPSASVAGIFSATPSLIGFMQQYDEGKYLDTGLLQDKDAAQKAVGKLTAAQAWSQFQALPQNVQQLFAEQVLFNVLTQVGEDYNNPNSRYYQQYSRGYQAINTLFPAAFGYTKNGLSGGLNGAQTSVQTGNLDIRGTTIQTQQGGSVSILGPGGRALIGSSSAPPAIVDSSGNVVAGPSTMGVLTLEQGDVDIFIDQSLLLAQSRVFTEQGGDMTIWSSNGDINAGKGSKSSADTPAPQYVCDVNHYCLVDARAEVTGAGIATLQSIPGSSIGTINLIAPRGTVDAGDAGIRAGNLNIAAFRVANADNIQVTGTSTGIPIVQAANTGALTAASSASSAANQMAQDMAKKNASGGGQHRWSISVQVEGFGQANDDRKRRKREQVSYDPSSSVSVVGFGATNAPQQRSVDGEPVKRSGEI
ncbi:filamentous hemagglutinin [Trinickia dabaoshanensis]|uniref:Filamentous hemagglutinin n=2 Tax=Trinickia dabaoshanensis TaxID=564714 RepID=A0A2N7VX82_9BURK|nr:filamentous hemagglutinin [Trinickia dabaoshanensis]